MKTEENTKKEEMKNEKTAGNAVVFENPEFGKILTQTDENGLASTAKDALPFGHYRVDETKSPKGYLNVGTISIEFDITKNGEIVELTAEDVKRQEGNDDFGNDTGNDFLEFLKNVLHGAAAFVRNAQSGDEREDEGTHHIYHGRYLDFEEGFEFFYIIYCHMG